MLRLLAVSAALEQRYNPILESVQGLSLREVLLLMNLESAPLHRMRRVDLAVALSLGVSSISHLADPLEREGLIAREADSRDARVVYATLTPAGLERVRAAKILLNESTLKLFDERWSQQDVDAFAKRLGQLAYGLPNFILD